MVTTGVVAGHAPLSRRRPGRGVPLRQAFHPVRQRAAASEREIGDGPGVVHARQAAQSIQQLLEEALLSRRPLIRRSGEPHGSGQYAIRGEPGIFVSTRP